MEYGMVSSPGAEKGEHSVSAAEISSALRAVQSAKGWRMEGRVREGWGGKKSLSKASLIWVGVVASGREGKRGVSLPRDSVTESTIIATIHYSDVGYCLFRNPLVTHIPYHVPSLLL